MIEVGGELNLDNWLAKGLLVLPDQALWTCIRHIEKGRPVTLAYGWKTPERRAETGNPVGLSFSQLELRANPNEHDLRWLAEEVFPRWAIGQVDDAHQPLPATATKRLLRLLREELEARR